jgi:hypothetical protein
MVPYLNESAPGDTEDVLTWNGTKFELDNAEVAFDVDENDSLNVLTASGDIELEPGGNVGVGIENPEVAFAVNGSGNFTDTIYVNNTEVATEASLNESTGAADGDDGAIQYAKNGNLTGNASLFRINDSSKTVGIGTSTPEAALEVVKNGTEGNPVTIHLRSPEDDYENSRILFDEGVDETTTLDNQSLSDGAFELLYNTTPEETNRLEFRRSRVN